MQFKEGDPVILTNLKYAGRDSDDIADVVIFPSGAKIALFEPLFGPSNLVSASALDEIKPLRGNAEDKDIDAWMTCNDAADKIEWLREQCDRMASLAIDNAKDTKRAMRFRKALRGICEVYAGSEGIPHPVTLAEGYLLSLLKKTVGIAQKALKESE